jgi:hypothetical protein
MTAEFAQGQSELAKIVRGQPDLSTYLVECDRGPEMEKFSDKELNSLARIYDSFSKLNFQFLGMATIALEDCYASTERPGRWQEEKAQLGDILPLPHRRIEEGEPRVSSPVAEARPPEIAVVAGLDHPRPE